MPAPAMAVRRDDDLPLGVPASGVPEADEPWADGV
jgi:hypothetical protein